MNILLVIGVIALVAFVIALVLSHDFRHWIGDTLTAIGLLIADAIPVVGNWLRDALILVRRVISIYAFILLITAIVALVLMAIALLIHWPTGSAFLFVLAICLVILAWLPAGIILRVFRVTDAVVPCALRALIAWIAFVGWLCLMAPDVITMKSLLGAALVGFIFFGSTFKTKAIDKLVVPLVIVMCLWTAWGYFWPESFRSTTRYTESWAKRIQTKKDRGSINNETDAATTYGQALKDITVLYNLVNDSILNDAMVDTLKIGTIVKIVSHKQEIKVIDGQGFIQIQLANLKGSFVRGQKYWVEAEFVQLANPREVTPDNPDLLKNRTAKTNQKPEAPKQVLLSKGVYNFSLKAGEKSPKIMVNGRYCAVSNNHDQFQLFYPTLQKAVPAWTSGSWPEENVFIIDSLVDQIVTIKVT